MRPVRRLQRRIAPVDAVQNNDNRPGKPMRILPFAFCAGLIFQAAHATDYYVSAHTGRDGNAGISQKHPWRSLNKVNAHRFRPGDRILLQSGSRWRTPLVINSSGTAAAPIRIDRYGKGPRPRIDVGGVTETAVTIRNVEHVEVRNLELTNHGKGTALRRGVLIAADNIGILHGITVAGLYIHDINGSNAILDNGGIVFRSVGRKTASAFDGLSIERNIIWRVDRNAIAGNTQQHAATRTDNTLPWFPSRNVVIRENYVEDIGGDGIVPWVTDGALVEHNIAVHTSQRGGNFTAGIWPWSTDNTLLQLNASSFTHGTRDGEGFDSDYNSRNTRFIYNLSHDNDGGFMLICSNGPASDFNPMANQSTVIRNNISWHDRHLIFALSGPVESTLIEDNAIYIGKDDSVHAVIATDWGGWAKDALFRGNLFAAQGTARYGHATARADDGVFTLAPGWGGATGIRFEGNRFQGTHVNPPEAVTEGDGAGAAIAAAIAGEPRFDPADPSGFDDYLVRHRTWMIALFALQFGHAPVLEGPARATTRR